jgi:hypothetical protein
VGTFLTATAKGSGIQNPVRSTKFTPAPLSVTPYNLTTQNEIDFQTLIPVTYVLPTNQIGHCLQGH